MSSLAALIAASSDSYDAVGAIQGIHRKRWLGDRLLLGCRRAAEFEVITRGGSRPGAAVFITSGRPKAEPMVIFRGGSKVANVHPPAYGVVHIRDAA